MVRFIAPHQAGSAPMPPSGVPLHTETCKTINADPAPTVNISTCFGLQHSSILFGPDSEHLDARARRALVRELESGCRTELQFMSRGRARSMSAHVAAPLAPDERRLDGRLKIVLSGDVRQSSAPRPGSTVLVVVVPQQSPYAAEMVVDECPADQPLTMFLRVGGPWRNLERRRRERLPLNVQPAWAARAFDGVVQSLRLRIENLSARGMGIISNQELRPGDRLDLRFALPKSTTSLKVQLDVTHVRSVTTAHGEVWAAGGTYHESSLAQRDLANPAGSNGIKPSAATRRVRRTG